MTRQTKSAPAVPAAAFSRRHPRVRVLLSAKLSTTTEESSVKIRDISLSGAMLQGRFLPRVGSDVMLTRGSFEIFATVAWRRDDMCGVAFDSPLSRLEELLEAGATPDDFVACTAALRHQPLRPSGDPTAEEMEAARAWAFPVGRQGFLD